MDREDWRAYCDAPEGPRRARLLAKLLRDNEPLVRFYVASFTKSSRYYTDNMRADLLQAASIGIIRALPAWDPDRGGFSSVAFRWALHEMQLVVRHATSVSVPKSAFLPRAKQDEAAKFTALHGREPEAHEIGLTEAVVDRAREATSTFRPLSDADEVPSEDPGPEAGIDQRRDQEALRAFLRGLKAKDRREFWTGTRPDLTQRAKLYVEGRRACRR